jgi:hypothetical protein
MMMKISLSAMAWPISQQIKSAGYAHIGKKNIETIDRLADATTLLMLHGAITEADCRKARKKIIKMIELDPS